MAIVIEDTQMELLAQQIAAAEGIAIDEVLRESLNSLADLRGGCRESSATREACCIGAGSRCHTAAHSSRYAKR